MKKKKLLFRIGSLRHGGAEKVLVNLLNHLSPNDFQVDLLVNLYTGQYIDEVPNWVRVFYLYKGDFILTNRPKELPLKTYRFLTEQFLKQFPWPIYRFLLKRTYDVEIAAIHGLYQEILNSPNKASKKVIWIQNDIYSPHSDKGNFTEIKKRTFFKADEIWAISGKIQKEALQFAPRGKENIVKKITNPIDFSQTIRKSEEKIQLPAFNSPSFMAIGSLIPQKGIDRLLQVHKRLLDEGFKHDIYVIGNGTDEENLRKIQEELGLQNSFHFLGYQPNPYPFLKSVDYFILPSRYEGFSTILVEALILRKPIIATDISGVSDILSDGSLGEIVSNDEAGIYQGMKRFLSQPDVPLKYVESLKNNQLSFSIESSTQKIVQLIHELIEK